MKRFLLILLAVLFGANAMMAQTARQEIDAHPHLAISTQSVYAGDYYFRPVAEAPKGYKPFYMSHYGRHGSRHESNEKYPIRVKRMFDIADSLGILTAKGQEAKAYIYKINEAHFERIGELTRSGFEQHKAIARRTYARFKPIFRAGSIIDSRSSVYTRCILSMAAFNESLKECEPLIETRMDAAEEHQKVIRPSMSHTKSAVKKVEAWEQYLNEWSRQQNVSHSANMLFTDIDKLCKELDLCPLEIMHDIYKRFAFMQNLDWFDRTLIDSIFTPDERYTIYLAENYKWYCRYVSANTGNGVKRFAPLKALVDDIIKYADLAIEGKNSSTANLRFGHDYFLLGLLAIINFNECSNSADISSVEKLGEEWPAFRVVSMASSLQIVFYRSKKSPDVLVRFLENENDVTLPIKSDIAPFYKWEDVKAYLNQRVAQLQ